MKIIKFGGYTCPACKKLEQVLQLKNYKVDEEIIIQDSDLTLARKYNVTTLPTLIKFNDKGNEIERINGLVALPRLKEFFEVE